MTTKIFQKILALSGGTCFSVYFSMFISFCEFILNEIFVLRSLTESFILKTCTHTHTYICIYVQSAICVCLRKCGISPWEKILHQMTQNHKVEIKRIFKF